MVRLWRTVGGAALRLPCSCPESSTASTPCFPEWPQLSLHCFNTASTHTHAHTHTRTHTHTHSVKKNHFRAARTPSSCRRTPGALAAPCAGAAQPLRMCCTAHLASYQVSAVLASTASSTSRGCLRRLSSISSCRHKQVKGQPSRQPRVWSPQSAFVPSKANSRRARVWSPQSAFVPSKANSRRARVRSPQSAFVPSKANSRRARAHSLLLYQARQTAAGQEPRQSHS